MTKDNASGAGMERCLRCGCDLLHMTIRGEQQPSPTAICSRCGVDRLKVECPRTIHPCHYVAIGSDGLPMVFESEIKPEEQHDQ